MRIEPVQPAAAVGTREARPAWTKQQTRVPEGFGDGLSEHIRRTTMPWTGCEPADSPEDRDEPEPKPCPECGTPMEYEDEAGGWSCAEAECGGFIEDRDEGPDDDGVGDE